MYLPRSSKSLTICSYVRSNCWIEASLPWANAILCIMIIILQDRQSLGLVSSRGGPELGGSPQQRRRCQILWADSTGVHGIFCFHQGVGLEDERCQLHQNTLFLGADNQRTRPTTCKQNFGNATRWDSKSKDLKIGFTKGFCFTPLSPISYRQFRGEFGSKYRQRPPY